MIVVLVVPGCHDMSLEEHELKSRGLTKEDLEAGPSDNDIRGRIVTDVRTTWFPELELDARGLRNCPAIRFEGAQPVCAEHQLPMKVFTLRNDQPDRQYPVQETAYFCPSDKPYYWYHYRGGFGNRDAWLGPRPIKLRKPREMDH